MCSPANIPLVSFCPRPQDIRNRQKSKKQTERNRKDSIEMNDDFNAMFADNEDLFDGLDEVDTWERTPWFEAGHQYLLEVESIKFVPSQQDPGVNYYILSFIIVESSCEDLPPGTKASHRIRCAKDAKTRMYGPMNFKQFLSGVMGEPASSSNVSWGALAKAAISEGELNGKKVRLQTNLNKTGKFTNHTYSYYGDQ
jgi:hypothetical protein